MSETGHEHLRRAQELLGHQVPSGDIAQVVERALGLLVAHLEKQKFSATDRPRPIPQRESTDPRHIRADVKRAVWARDQGRCTFVSDAGRRCEARSPLEFDHALEVARGGEASVSDIRLRCRAHNQHTAETTFGAEFMRHKRVAAAGLRDASHGRARAARARFDGRPGTGNDDDRDVIPWLRRLGFSAAECRLAAGRCEALPDASLEERVRHALSCVGVRGKRVGPAAAR